MKYRWGFRAVRFLGIAIVAGVLLGLLVMLLWNALIPDLFHGPALTLVQALGLLLLSHVLLRGWGRWGHWSGWRHERWRKRLDEKLASMAPEEREKFRQEWRYGCGWHQEGAGKPKEEPGL